MSDDKELLELAAKAAGIERGKWDYNWLRSLGHMVTPNMMWNPLLDDGDALRLAVKLCMQVECSEGNQHVSAYGYAFRITEQHGRGFQNAEEATRRAIVRAAAEIGHNQHSGAEV